jgi:hypothetical protein
MSIDTFAKLAYGVLYPPDYQFAWSGDKYENDIDSWWYDEVCKYKPPFMLYDEHGGLLPGFTDEDVRRYWSDRNDFEKKNPTPVRVVRAGHFDDVSGYIICLPKLYVSIRAYEVQKIDLDMLLIYSIDIEKIVSFCKQYAPLEHIEPHWYLCAEVG